MDVFVKYTSREDVKFELGVKLLIYDGQDFEMGLDKMRSVFLR